MQYQLNIWTHPATQQVRIYVAGAPLESGDKLYIFAATNGSWDAKLYCPYGPNHLFFAGMSGAGSTLYDMGLTIAERALAERGLDKATFESIVEVLDGTGEAVAFDAAAANRTREADEAKALKARGELSGLAIEARGGFTDSVQRLSRARSVIKGDDELMLRLASLKLSGSRRLGTKAHQRDAELAHSFGLSIGVPELSADEIGQLKSQLKV